MVDTLFCGPVNCGSPHNEDRHHAPSPDNSVWRRVAPRRILAGRRRSHQPVRRGGRDRLLRYPLPRSQAPVRSSQGGLGGDRRHHRPGACGRLVSSQDGDRGAVKTFQRAATPTARPQGQDGRRRMHHLWHKLTGLPTDLFDCPSHRTPYTWKPGSALAMKEDEGAEQSLSTRGRRLGIAGWCRAESAGAKGASPTPTPRTRNTGQLASKPCGIRPGQLGPAGQRQLRRQ